MAENENTRSNAIWAVALVLIVLIIAGAAYYSGILQGPAKKADVEITVPAR